MPRGSETAERQGLADLLTQEEAITFLRLDVVNLKRPKEALRYLRRTGQIAYIKVCGKVMFTRKALEDYLARHATEARA